MRLTAKNVHDLPLPEGKTEHLYPDDDIPGFALRVRAGGARRLTFQYKIGHLSKKITLGAVTALNFAETRKAAEKLYARVRLGEDPAAARDEARLEAAETFEAAMRRYLEDRRAHLRPRSYWAVEYHLATLAKPLHRLALSKVERRNIATVLDLVERQHGRVVRNRLRSSAASFYAWAIGKGLTETNPVNGTVRAEEKARERVLSDEELRLIWTNLKDGHYAAVVRLLILTGQRATEIADLKWSEIIDDKIILGPERTKNGRAHIIPLSAAAGDILEAQPRRAGRDLIFGLGQNGFGGFTPPQKALNRRIADATGKFLPHWVHHDLRRTAATGMANIGILPHVIEAVLNHQSGHKAGSAGVYNLSPYLRETTIALNRWADRVLAIVSGQESNIVPMRG
jgi:integrase